MVVWRRRKKDPQLRAVVVGGSHGAYSPYGSDAPYPNPPRILRVLTRLVLTRFICFTLRVFLILIIFRIINAKNISYY